jgi:signal transduction histidine kinase
MAIRSLRFRITSLAMVVVVAILIVFATVLSQSVESHLVQQVDLGLVNQAKYVQTSLAKHQYLSRSGPTGQLGQLVSASGTLIGAGSNLQGMPPLIHVTPGDPNPRLSTIYNPRFGHVRVLQQQFGAKSAPILIEGQEINQIFDAENSMNRLFIFGLPILAVVLGILIWFVVGQAMKPVEKARLAVAEISANDLDEEVPSPKSGDELDRLVSTMNAMLRRLQAALRRERRFIADASHELRSPIAAIRSALESHDQDMDGLRQSHENALSAVQRLDILADDLLRIESFDSSRSGPDLRPIDLDELVLAQVERLQRNSDLSIGVSSVSAGQVYAREMDMTRIVENLSSNAVRHADHRIDFSVVEEGSKVLLSVADDGPGIPVAMREAVFERFVRIGDDRNRESGGSGLGLSIVSEIVSAYGGRVWIDGERTCGTKFVVELPATTSAVDAS